MAQILWAARRQAPPAEGEVHRPGARGRERPAARVDSRRRRPGAQTTFDRSNRDENKHASAAAEEGATEDGFQTNVNLSTDRGASGRPRWRRNTGRTTPNRKGL